MLELIGEKRSCIKALCVGREEEVPLFSAMEGRMGRLWVDREMKPDCSLVLSADFCYLLGDYKREVKTEILQIISDSCPGKILVIEKQWEPILSDLERSFPDSFRSFSRYAMEGRLEWFNPQMLRDYVAAVEKQYTIRRVDEELYRLTAEQPWTLDFCSNFRSAQDFMEHGIGYMILQEGEIIAGASSYASCEGKIEVSIETKEEFRGRGLAKACASKLILECLERQIYPRWDAANIASVALAEKLNYHFIREYTVYSI